MAQLRRRQSIQKAEASRTGDDAVSSLGEIRNSARSKIEYIPPNALKPYKRALRARSEKFKQQVKASVREFDLIDPIVVDKDGTIVVGHARWEAAKELNYALVPVVRIAHLSPEQVRAYRIAENQLGQLAPWDEQTLGQELLELSEIVPEIPMDVLGFETAKIDQLIESLNKTLPADPDDDVPAVNATQAVTRVGDMWLMEPHRMVCGDALDQAALTRLLADEKAAMVFVDPPFNVRINGHVSGLGRVRHNEFAMASGEMSSEEFTDFLKGAFVLLEEHSVDGSIHFIMMDWRHVLEIMTAARDVYAELKNLIIWVKTNAGMGAFYRSQHELVFVFKKGKAPHQNNFGLGEKGRHRTNVWTYPGANTFREGRDEDLAAHPTVKPVAMIADAIRDCSRRGEIILDTFGGSGTTLLAAERTGRRGFLIEIEPGYVDVTIERWQQMTQRTAVLADTGMSFDEVRRQRSEKTAEVGPANVPRGERA